MSGAHYYHHHHHHHHHTQRLPLGLEHLVRHRGKINILTVFLIPGLCFIFGPRSACEFFPVALGTRIFLEVYWYLRGYRHFLLSFHTGSRESKKSLDPYSSAGLDLRHSSKSLIISIIAATVFLFVCLTVGICAVGFGYVETVSEAVSYVPSRLHQRFHEIPHQIETSIRFHRVQFHGTISSATEIWCQSLSLACLVRPDLVDDSLFIHEWTEVNTRQAERARAAFRTYRAGRDIPLPAYECLAHRWCESDRDSGQTLPGDMMARILKDKMAPTVASYTDCILNLNSNITAYLDIANEISERLIEIWDKARTSQSASYNLKRRLALVYGFHALDTEDTLAVRVKLVFKVYYSVFRMLRPTPTLEEQLLALEKSYEDIIPQHVSRQANECSRLARHASRESPKVGEDLLKQLRIAESSRQGSIPLHVLILAHNYTQLFSSTISPSEVGPSKQERRWEKEWADVAVTKIGKVLIGMIRENRMSGRGRGRKRVASAGKEDLGDAHSEL